MISVVYHATERPTKASCLYSGSEGQPFELGTLDLSVLGGDCWVEWNVPTTVTVAAVSDPWNEDTLHFTCLTKDGSQVDGDGSILCTVGFDTEQLDGDFTVGTLEGVVKMAFSDGEFDYDKVKKLGYKPSTVSVIY
ncbi:MAG: hypothetical protein HZC05_01620 [Candidatus Magasanikbacteria bacterium]|nr:hypothetical protein [Candidatus Magasanikbacteria bacterium]